MRKVLIFLFFFNSITMYSQYNWQYFIDQASVNQNSQKYLDAITNYNSALELLPDSLNEQISLTYWNLQYCYSSLKENSMAISACYSWINKGGWYLGNAYYCLGINYYNNGEYSKAIDAYSNAIQYSNSVIEGRPLNINDIYSYIKYNYQKLGYSYGSVPKALFWKVSIPHGYWEWQDKGKTCCINTFAVRVENRLPISIQFVNIDLIIKDKKGTIVYKRSHTAWVNGLNTNEVAQSDYFNLNNEVCLPCSYINSEKFSWSCDITGVAY